MKKYIVILLTLATLVSCNDDFLEKSPIEKLSETTAFGSYDNFKTFSMGFYSVFSDYTPITRSVDQYFGSGRGDVLSGYLFDVNANAPNYYASQTATTFAAANDAGNYFNYATGGWDFSFIRRANILLQNIDQSKMTDIEKKHWRSVGYFFHSYLYMELVSRYGDVPWVNKTMNDVDPQMFAGRNPRTQVVDSIMDRLIYAENNIKVAGDGVNTINKACVQVLISRFGLFEGTWRKYQSVSDAGSKYTQAKLLQESARASEALITARPTLNANYDALYNSESLTTNTGVILYKEFLPGIITGYIGRYCRTSEIRYEMPKQTVELYLTKNGLPIYNANNTQYAGDKSMYNEFRNRDNRLLMTVIPPYYSNTAYKYTPPASLAVNVNEYVNLLPTVLSSTTSKRLPASNWSGSVMVQSPNIVGPGQAFMKSYTGYSTFRFYNLWDDNNAGKNHADMPIFHMGEILLNYAEAKWELGQFTQAIADASINKLRARAQVANMVVANINNNFDPARDQTVDPVLWEIRRERQIELMCEGFGFDDIRRWKKAPWYLNRNITGVYIRYADYTDSKTGAVVPSWQSLSLVDKNFVDVPKTATGEGYIKRFPNQASIGKGWLDKYYLLPLPLNEVALNPSLLPNNPGW